MSESAEWPLSHFTGSARKLAAPFLVAVGAIPVGVASDSFALVGIGVTMAVSTYAMAGWSA